MRRTSRACRLCSAFLFPRLGLLNSFLLTMICGRVHQHLPSRQEMAQRTFHSTPLSRFDISHLFHGTHQLTRLTNQCHKQYTKRDMDPYYIRKDLRRRRSTTDHIAEISFFFLWRSTRDKGTKTRLRESLHGEAFGWTSSKLWHTKETFRGMMASLHTAKTDFTLGLSGPMIV